jgi:hypothetical protein
MINSQKIQPRWLSYDEASSWYQGEGVTNWKELQEHAKKGLPKGIPSNPKRLYRKEFKDGGLQRFLGTGPYSTQPLQEETAEPETIIPKQTIRMKR